MAAVAGGAPGMNKMKVTKSEIMNMIENHPDRYRVGATTNIQERMWAYLGQMYAHRNVYYAKTYTNSCLQRWENEALSRLSDSQTYNTQRTSGIRANRKGYLYIIYMY